MARHSTSLAAPLAMLALGGAVLLIALSKPKQPAASSPAALTAAQQSQIVTLLQSLGVDAAGTLKGPVTPDSIMRVRAFAKTLGASGFPEAANTLLSYAVMADQFLKKG